MKLEEFLMQRSEEKQKRLALEEEVLKMQEELNGEKSLNAVLHCSLYGSALPHPFLLSLLPPQVQELFSELEMVEDEICGLERKVEELKLMLYKERVQTREREMHMRQREQNQALFRDGDQLLIDGSRSQNYEALRKLRKESRRLKDRRASVSSASDMQRWNFTKADAGEIAEMSRRLSRRNRIQRVVDNESGILKPNELSEQLLKCIIGIFLELKQTSLDNVGSSSVVPKLTLSCMNSKGFVDV